jgi:glycosyltransferase involved in cell wall biosynthesis
MEPRTHRERVDPMSRITDLLTPPRLPLVTAPVYYFGNVPFDSHWQRPQLLAMCLAESTDVLYIDPNRSFVQFLKNVSQETSASAAQIPGRLRRLTPRGGFPLARSVAALHSWNCRRTFADLTRHAVAQQLWPPRALIATFPDQLELVRRFAGVPVLYDVMDEPSLFLKPWQRRRYARLHQELLELAAAVVTSSTVLQRRCAAAGVSAVCIPNGVRQELFHELATASPNPVLAALPRPRFGYVGMISHWFDFDAVAELARAFPHGSVVLVGPVACHPPRLPSNVTFIGPVPHLELASYLIGFDAGLVPFKRSAAIDAVNPVKLYEYLAAGLPVLSSHFEEMEQYREFVSFYTNSADCAAAARAALARLVGGGDAPARQAFARLNCWARKAEQMAAALRRARGKTPLAGTRS